MKPVLLRAIWLRAILLKSMASAVGGMLQQLATYGCLRVAWALSGYPVWHRQGLQAHHLTDAFRDKGLLDHNNAVAALEWHAIEWGAIGRVYRVKPSYRYPAAGLPSTLIVKTLGETLPSMIMSRLFKLLELETRAVTDLRTHCRDLQPDIHLVASHPRLGMGCIVMEDLGHLRNQRSHAPGGASVEDARLLLAACGKLHGLTWGKVAFASYYSDSPIMTHRFGKLAKAFLEGPFKPLIAAHLPHLKRALMDFSCRDFQDAFLVRTRGYGLSDTQPRAPLPHRYFAIGHNDVRLDNAFFDDQRQECRLIDWQTPLYQNPVNDVAWALKELPLASLTHEIITALLSDYRAAVADAMNGSTAESNRGDPTAWTEATLLQELPWGCYAAVTLLMFSQMLVSRIKEPIPLDINAPLESTLLTNLRNYSVRVDHLLGLCAPADFRAQACSTQP